MPSKFVLQGVEELQRVAGNYSRGRSIVNEILRKACNKFAIATRTTSLNKYMSKAHSGQRKNDSDILRVQTGQLRSRVYTDVQEDAEGFTVALGVDNIPYAAIHEYGGTILRKGKVTTIRERSYLRRSIKDTIGPFTEDVTETILGAVRAGFDRGEL
jgi:phage gpG-like protein